MAEKSHFKRGNNLRGIRPPTALPMMRSHSAPMLRPRWNPSARITPKRHVATHRDRALSTGDAGRPKEEKRERGKGKGKRVPSTRRKPRSVPLPHLSPSKTKRQARGPTLGPAQPPGAPTVKAPGSPSENRRSLATKREAVPLGSTPTLLPSNQIQRGGTTSGSNNQGAPRKVDKPAPLQQKSAPLPPVAMRAEVLDPTMDEETKNILAMARWMSEAALVPQAAPSDSMMSSPSDDWDIQGKRDNIWGAVRDEDERHRVVKSVRRMLDERGVYSNCEDLYGKSG